MTQIAIIGECMIELNGAPFGEMHQTFGGDTLNAAVYLSRSNSLFSTEPTITTSYVTALGKDALSMGMLHRWQNEGIDTSLVLLDDNHSPGLYLIQLDDQGERTFLYWRNDSAAKYIFQHDGFTDVHTKLAEVDMVFVSGISLAIFSVKDRTNLVSLIGSLKAKGVKISFDSNYRPSLWNGEDVSIVRENYKAMYNLTDLALVTFDDEAKIWGDNAPHDTIQRLHKYGINQVVVKLGEQGCMVSNNANDTPVLVPSTKVNEIVDTTSAGDSFNGGFLSCYLTGGSLIESSIRGNALASIVIQHQGAIVPKLATNSLIKHMEP